MPARYFGKYTGIVRDNRDPKRLGHLEVVVPSIFPEDEEVIARAALPYGFFFVPEIDAKVWVEFEGGDPGLPIWTGVQYTQGEWAKEAEDEPPEKRVVKSAAGHLVILNDRRGEESIVIKDGHNRHELTFDATTITIKHGSSGAKIEIGPSGITIDGVGPIKLSAGAAMPVLRVGDQGIGNLGAPVVLTGPGNPLVVA